MNYLSSYKNEIKNKRIVVCQKMKDTITRLEQLEKKYYFDQSDADYFIRFIEKLCKHFEGQFAGKEFKLTLWQKVIVEAAFGIKNKDGNRVVREVFVVVARKNGKSTFASALALAMLIADGEAGSQVYSIANKLEQANVIYKSCYQMLMYSQSLQRAIRKTRVSLEYGSSILRPLASDSKSLDGLNPHFAIYDEGHATKNNDLYDVIKSGMGMRTQPMMMHITTAGTVRGGIFDYLYSYAEKILKEEVEDDTFVPFIFELDDAKEIDNENMWQKANPNIDISVKREFLRTEVMRAKNDAAARVGVLTKNFNIRQAHSKAFHRLDEIRNSERVNFESLRGVYAIVGVDLSSTTDLTCVSWLVPYEDKYIVHQKYFIPEGNLAWREEKEKRRYQSWIDKGYVDVCQGNTINTRQITKYIADVAYKQEIYIQSIAVDRWGASEFNRIMSEEHGIRVDNIAQGAKTFSPVMKQLNGDFKDKKIIHNNNPVFIWNTTNVGVQSDVNGNIRPVKGNGSLERIDGYMANLNAYAFYQSCDGYIKSVFDYQPYIEIERGD